MTQTNPAEPNDPASPELALPLEYARAEDNLLLLAYRLVGWYFVISAILAVLTVGSNFLVYRTQPALNMMWPSFLYAIPFNLTAIGAIGMILGRPWGAIVLIAFVCLRIPVQSASIFMSTRQPSSSSIFGPYALYASVTFGTLSAATSSFLPFVFYRLCKKHNAFRP